MLTRNYKSKKIHSSPRTDDLAEVRAHCIPLRPRRVHMQETDTKHLRIERCSAQNYHKPKRTNTLGEKKASRYLAEGVQISEQRPKRLFAAREPAPTGRTTHNSLEGCK